MDPLQPGARFGDYVIEEAIGRGGMSVIYRAQEQRLRRTVALKVLSSQLAGDEEFRRRFLREWETAAQLGHPNILPVYAAGEEEGLLFMAMPLIEGRDLGELVRRGGPLDPERALTIVTQVGRALDAAHRHGLVHRDVKPANVLVVLGATPTEPEHAYLSDFGLARRSQASTRLTRHDTFVGTRDYAAPEQIRGDDVDGRADIYALGCLLFECLTGEVPFDADSDHELIYAVLEKEPPRVSEKRPGVPAALDGVVARAMAKDPRDRPASCHELALELSEAIARGRAGTVREAAPTEAERRPAVSGEGPGGPGAWLRRNWKAMLAGAGGLVVAFVVVLLLAGGDGDGPGTTAADTGTGTETTDTTDTTETTGRTDTGAATGPAGSLSQAEESLAISVPEELRDTCRSREPEETASKAAIECQSPGADYLILEAFDTEAQARAAADRYGSDLGQGTCGSRWNVEGRWVEPGDPDFGGQLRCYGTTEGNEINWTYDRFGETAWIGRSDGDRNALIEAWQEACFTTCAAG